MSFSIPSHVAQTVYIKINALKACLATLPEGPEKAEAMAREADLHGCLHAGFIAQGGAYIKEDDFAGQATTNATSVILLSGGTDDKG